MLIAELSCHLSTFEFFPQFVGNFFTSHLFEISSIKSVVRSVEVETKYVYYGFSNCIWKVLSLLQHPPKIWPTSKFQSLILLSMLSSQTLRVIACVFSKSPCRICKKIKLSSFRMWSVAQCTKCSFDGFKG